MKVRRFVAIVVLAPLFFAIGTLAGLLCGGCIFVRTGLGAVELEVFKALAKRAGRDVSAKEAEGAAL